MQIHKIVNSYSWLSVWLVKLGCCKQKVVSSNPLAGRAISLLGAALTRPFTQLLQRPSNPAFSKKKKYIALVKST